LTNVGQNQKQDGRYETGSGNIFGCTTDTDEIVVHYLYPSLQDWLIQ